MKSVNATDESGNNQVHWAGLKNFLSSNEKHTCRSENDSNQLQSELLDMIMKQERSCENAEAAVEKLERHLKLLKVSVSMEAIALLQETLDNNDTEIGEDKTHRRICVSTVFDDETSDIMYRTHAFMHGNNGFDIMPFHIREGQDVKDLEIRRVKSELQRRKLEIQRRPHADLRRLLSYGSQEERSIVSDKFVDKLNTSSQHARDHLHDDTQLLKVVDSNKDTEASAEDINGLVNRPKEEIKSSFGTPNKSLVSTVHIEALEEDAIALGRADSGKDLSSPPYLESSFLSHEISRSTYKLQETINACLLSMRNLCTTIKSHSIQNNASTGIDEGAIEDELFILEETIIKLKEFCEEPGNRAISGIMNHQIDCEKPGCQNIINRIILQHAQVECKITALESACIEKDKKIEDLESQIRAILKDTENVVNEKYELASVVREMYMNAEKQRQRIDEILNLNEELLEFSQTMEDKLKLLNAKMESYRKRLKDAEEENISLSQRVTAQKRTLRDMKQDHESLRNGYEILKLNLAWAEFQRRQQKAALETVTSHLHLYKEYSQDTVCDYETNHMSPYRQKQLRRFIDDLEEKLLVMETEVSKAIREMPLRKKLSNSNDGVLDFCWHTSYNLADDRHVKTFENRTMTD